MKDFKILGLGLPLYLIVAAVTIVAIAMGILPANMIGAFLFLMVIGELLNLIGNNLPIVKTYFGGGPIVVIFGGAALVYFGIIPTPVVDTVTNFMKNPGGFLDFYIAALITGSILGMNRDLLIKSAIRFLPTIIAGVVVSLLVVFLVGPLVGYSGGEAVAYVGIPIMGGGMGAGAVPIANVFETALGIPADQILSRLVPAVALGNAFAIVAGGLLDKLGKAKPSLTGNGIMMSKGNFKAEEVDTGSMTITDYATGIVIALGFFVFGVILSELFEMLTGVSIHSYAWMILSVAIVKAIGVMPEKAAKATNGWYKFVAGNWTAGLMLGIGISYTSLGDIIAAFTPGYVILVFLVILGAIIGTAVVGKFLGFYPIEAAITAGLCMANMGGTGDVAVLTASHRMELMPFAQISSRLGGAFIIFLASLLVPVFF